MPFECAIATDIGQKRQQNQDNGGVYPELGLFVVADGMGGHQGGETASAMVVEIVPDHVRRAQKKNKKWNAQKVITAAIKAASDAIYKRSQNDHRLEGMGTTTTTILFKDDRLTIGHVGDSRCYFFRPGAIWQLTKDHSLVEENLRQGKITREEAKTHTMKNVITRSVGFEPQVDVEVYDMPVATGDVFLVCSDGLSGLVENDQMLKIVQDSLFKQGDLQATVKQLVQAANQNGGDDNITVLVVQIK
ncbi:MAG: Stp1/IreP family PP2C-type Ser/Thr phosphatase [Bacteriovoracia bacterium]